MKKLILYVFLTLPFAYTCMLDAVVKGSTSSVSIEPFFTFPAADLDNKIDGFGWFKNGFSLEDGTTTCDFASVYPVSGIINLNGGTLNLLEDLILKNFTVLQGLGTIIGNNYLVEFCSTVTALPANTDTFQDVYIALSNTIELQGVTAFAGSTVLDGRGHTVQLHGNGAVVVASNSTLQLKNMIIKGIKADNIRCFDDTATLILDNVKWVQDEDMQFAQGALYIKDKAEFYGDAVFAHTSNVPITIGRQSLWSVLASVNLELGKRKVEQAVDPLVFEDDTSVWKLSNCSLLVTDGGLQLIKGRLIFDEEVEIDMQSTDTTNGLIFGDGIDPENDFSVRFNSGVSVTHAGHTVYNNTSPDKIDALSKNATLIRELSSYIYMATNITLPSMTFVSLSNTVPPIDGGDGVSITYNDNQVIFPAAAFDITGRQQKFNTFNLEGSHEIFFSKGSLPLNLEVSGSNNLMHGNGGVTGLITLQDDTTELKCCIQGALNQSAVLNGGSIELGADLILGPDVMFTGSGVIDVTSCRVQCGSKDLVWTGTTTWQGDDGSIDMRAQISLTGYWKIEGSVTINGNGNTLDLGTIGQIVIAPGATLRCKDVRLNGISETNIRCADDTASLVLEDVVWVQDGNFRFSTGSLTIKDQVDFMGKYTFTYDSLKASTILMKSEWHVFDGMRFEIGKNPNSSEWPLVFADHTSVLHLDNCSYVITGFGMQITKGTIMYSRDVIIDIQSTDISNGSIMGNGIAQDDPIIQFNPGSAARFVSGHMTWDVTDATKLRSDTTTVNIARSGGNTYYIKQDLTLKKFTVSSDPSVVTIIEPGKKLAYDECLFKLPNGQIAVTGSRYNEYASLLDGNDSIFLHYGTLPLATFVLGTGNRIEGNGTITGPIVLIHPTAVLHCNLGGTLEGNLMLNGGTVNLEGGLKLADDAVISTGGLMNLGSYSLDFPSKETVWSSLIVWNGQSAALNLNGKTSLSGQWVFTGNCTINGNGNALDLSSGGNLVINDGIILTLKDVRLTGLDTESIVMKGNGSALVLDDMSWVQSDNVTFDTGSIRFVGEVDFLGSHTFTYDSANTSTIAVKSTWQVADGMRLEMGRKSLDAATPLYFEDNTSTLNFDNCGFHVTEYGLQLARGRVLCSRDVAIDLSSTSTLNGLHLGDGTDSGDMVFEFFPGCSVSYGPGHVVYDITKPDSVKSRSNTSKLIRQAGSVFSMKQDVLLENLTIDASLYAITNVDDGKSFGYSNCLLELPTGKVIVNGQRYNAYTNLLTTGDSLFLSNGMMPMYTVVLGTDNSILGNGSLTGGLILLNPGASLALAIDGLVSKDISLGGGTLALGQDAHFACGTIITDSGTVDLNNFRMQICSEDAAWAGTIEWQSTNGSLIFDSDLALSGTWMFNDNCTIQGNGNVLDLTPGGNMYIAPGSTLKLSNLRVRGISGTNIQCLDDTSSLILDDVVWVQDGDFNFSQGSIVFNDTVDFLGSYTFAYTSKKSSSINEKSTWHLANNMRFEIGKQPEVAAQNPLVFTDATSTLHLDNCSFIVTDSGWDVLKGCIQYSRDVSIEVLSTSTQNGAFLGDGTVENDPLVLFDPGSNARFKKGHLIYNIVDSSKLRSDSSTVNMIRMADSYFQIKQNVILKNFTIDASALAVTDVDEGKAFRYDNCIFILPDGRAEVTAYRYNAVSNLLTNNDMLFMRYGSMPMATIVQGPGNKIAGTGDITGPIIFLGPTAALACDLSGSIDAQVMLNGGTFSMNNDLQLRDMSTFTTAGIIDLDSSQLSLGSKDAVWQSTIHWQADEAVIEMNAKVLLEGSWIFNGNCTINGNGNVLDLGSTGTINIGPGVRLTLRDIRLTGIIDSSFEWLGDDSVLVLDDVTWVQKGDFTLDKGSILFKGIVDFNGPHSFIMDTMSTTTIAMKSHWDVSDGLQLVIGRAALNGPEPLYFEDASSTLCLNNCAFNVSPHGLQMTRGRVVNVGDVTVDIQSTDITNGLYFGDGTRQGNMVFEFNAGANVSFRTGHVVYDVTVPDSVLSRSTLAKLTRHSDSNFYIKQNVELQNLTIDASLYATTTIADGKTFDYKNCSLLMPAGSVTAHAQRYNAATNLLDGNKSIFLSSGSYPMSTIIAGTGNYIQGNGSITGLITLLDENAQLIIGVDGLISQDIVLNGGTVILGQDASFGNKKHFTGDGTIHLGGNRVSFGPQDSSWMGELLWHGAEGQIEFNANVALSNTWTFSDSCVLYCKGNTLDLSGGGEIVLHDDAQLRIRDAHIKGISGSNIRCLSDNGKLVLENVIWIQEDDYQFTHGSIEFKHTTHMQGDSVFAYQSEQKSSILEQSCLCLGAGFTFRYDPGVTGTQLPDQNLIACNDLTSVLELKGSTLHAVHGIQLTNGSLLISKNAQFMCPLQEDQSITIGNGLQEHDCKVTLESGVQLKIAQGTLNYHNRLLSSWTSSNNLSTLYFADNTTLSLFESLDVGAGRILFGNETALLRADGKDLTGSVTTEGELSFGGL